MKRISIIVGHTKESQGAINYKGESEYAFNSRIAEKVAKHIKRINSEVEVRIFFRDGIGRSGVANLVKEWKADISIELHFNSFKEKAYGIEILVLHKDIVSMMAADAITDELADKFQLRERCHDGVRLLNDGERGYYNLKLLQSIPLVMLIEPCFANIETSESRAIFEDEDKYAVILGNELIKTLGLSISNQPLPTDEAEWINSTFHVVHVPDDETLGNIIEQLNEAYRTIAKKDEIINAQNDAWTELSNKLTQSVNLIEEGINEVIVKSQEAWIDNS